MPEDTILKEEITEKETAEEEIAEKETAEEITEKETAEEITEEKRAENVTVERTFADGEQENIEYFEEEKPRRIFRFGKADEEFSRDRWILSRIREEDLMEYLRLEQKRNEQLQQIKEKRSKRFMTAFQLTVSLAAIVAVVYLLKDAPTILVNILYISGILAVLWMWKNPHDRDKK